MFLMQLKKMEIINKEFLANLFLFFFWGGRDSYFLEKHTDLIL